MTSRHVAGKRDNFHFLRYVLISLLVNLYSKLHVIFIPQWIAFIFGKDKEEDQ